MPAETLLEAQEIKDSIESLESKRVIKHYGVFWDRNKVNWNSNHKLLGTDSPKGSIPINFDNMRGIYLLYDFREVVYVGQAKNSSIATRLKDHTKDRHANRWNRFSWFGIDTVNNETGEVEQTPETISLNLKDLVDALEGLLIEGIEPRQNRQRGNDFGNEYYQYIRDVSPKEYI